MTSRERLLTALANGRPDRLPCQVHYWMSYYLNTYLDGIDQFEAYERFGMDWVIYESPREIHDPQDLESWEISRSRLGEDSSGNAMWKETISTPGGTLDRVIGGDEYTSWDVEPLIRSKEDFALWDEYLPLPKTVDFSPLRAARERLGEQGILRCGAPSFGQGSAFQSLALLAGTERVIFWAIDEPQFLHHALRRMTDKTLRILEQWEGIPLDLVETGGGAGSDTVISPAMHEEFCLPYDIELHDALRALGLQSVYHLCGGVMDMLDLVARNGADGLETMTPPGMGGNCDLAEASRRVGGSLFFIGGFDQQAGFQRGTPQTARRLVQECFEATRDHAGYICSPSDHFFHGDPANLQAFADACRACVY